MKDNIDSQAQEDELPQWMAGLLSPSEPVSFTEEDMEKAERMIREAYQARLKATIIPFDAAKVEVALSDFRQRAAASSDHDDRFAVVLVESEEPVDAFQPAGHAELLEGPVESEAGEIYVSWQWEAVNNGVGYEGLKAAVVDSVTGAVCGRGILQKEQDDWRIVMRQGEMSALSSMSGKTHHIQLIG